MSRNRSNLESRSASRLWPCGLHSAHAAKSRLTRHRFTFKPGAVDAHGNIVPRPNGLTMSFIHTSNVTKSVDETRFAPAMFFFSPLFLSAVRSNTGVRDREFHHVNAGKLKSHWHWRVQQRDHAARAASYAAHSGENTTTRTANCSCGRANV